MNLQIIPTSGRLEVSGMIALLIIVGLIGEYLGLPYFGILTGIGVIFAVIFTILGLIKYGKILHQIFRELY